MGGSTRFVREDEREEMTLRTRSRRLPVDDDGTKGRVALLTPSSLLGAGVGVGIPLSVSNAVDLSSFVKEEGRLRWLLRPGSGSFFTGTTGTSGSV